MAIVIALILRRCYLPVFKLSAAVGLDARSPTGSHDRRDARYQALDADTVVVSNRRDGADGSASKRLAERYRLDSSTRIGSLDSQLFRAIYA